MMRLLLYAISFIILFSSCEHKELCYHHPHTVTVRVEFDWKDAADASPKGMCVYFYPTEGGSGQRFDFNNRIGGDIQIPVGRYYVLCFNNDTEIVQFYNSDSFDTHGVYTREGNVLEPIFGNSVNYVPRASGTEDERVLISPDMMWGCTLLDVDITDERICYTYFSKDDREHSFDIKEISDEMVITLYPHELICTYTYEVRNVKNLKHVVQMSGSLSGMSGRLTFSTEEIGEECITVPFEAESDGISMVTGKFYTFGHHLDNVTPHNMVFYAIMDDGVKYCFKDFDNLNVTRQVHEAPDYRHVHIVIDGLELPQPIENGHGYKPDVDDWEVVEEDIIL